MKSSPLSPQLEKPLVQQRRASATNKKKKKKEISGHLISRALPVLWWSQFVIIVLILLQEILQKLQKSLVITEVHTWETRVVCLVAFLSTVWLAELPQTTGEHQCLYKRQENLC